MRIDIISVIPEMIEGFVTESILARAQKKGLVEIRLHNLRDYTLDKWRRVDDYPYGGSAGMVMQCEPIDRCISALKAERDYEEVIYTSPDGEKFDQPLANELSLKGNMIILCGHYKGIDQRVRDHLITREISIGDYVLTGGELAAAVMTDAIVRLIPGSISDEQSALIKSKDRENQSLTRKTESLQSENLKLRDLNDKSLGLLLEIASTDPELKEIIVNEMPELRSKFVKDDAGMEMG